MGPKAAAKAKQSVEITLKNNSFKGLGYLEAELDEKDRVHMRGVKKDTHKIFDSLWKYLPMPSPQKRDEYRSNVYKLWGAVMESIDGVRNPRTGEQHISVMSEAECEKCQKFVSHLFTKYRDSIQIAAHINVFVEDCDSYIREHTPTDMLLSRWLNSNALISELRRASQVSTSFSAVSPSKVPTRPAELTAAQHFTEGMVAMVRGNTVAQLEHLQAASDKNHAEASWTLYQFCQSDEATPEQKGQALSHLEKAIHGAYIPAWGEVKRLYQQGVVTPYVQELEAAAAPEDAPAEALCKLAHYCESWLGDLSRAELLYKRAHEQYPSSEAYAHLQLIYYSHSSLFFINDQEESHHEKALQQKTAGTAIGKVVSITAELKTDKQLAQRKTAQQVLEEVLETMLQAEKAGDKEAEFERHHLAITKFIFLERKSRFKLEESIVYLSEVARKFSGSLGEDSRYNVDIRTTSKKELSISRAPKAAAALAQYYELKGITEDAKYWREYERWIKDSSEHHAYKLSEIPAKISPLLRSIAGNEVAAVRRDDRRHYFLASIPGLTPASVENLKEYSIIVEPRDEYNVGPVTYTEFTRIEQAKIIADRLRMITKIEPTVRHNNNGYFAARLTSREEVHVTQIEEKLNASAIPYVKEGNNI